eukprot:3956293-Prymnesium_polylepis.1
MRRASGFHPCPQCLSCPGFSEGGSEAPRASAGLNLILDREFGMLRVMRRRGAARSIEPLEGGRGSRDWSCLWKQQAGGWWGRLMLM